MPRLIPIENMDNHVVPGTGNFTFSAVRPEDLGATEYTLVTIVIDVTGSVMDFAHQLRAMLIAIIQGCKKNQRAENLLIRVVTFNTSVNEVHGFKPLISIDENTYEELSCGGITALYDATYSAVGATTIYAEDLVNQDFDVNAVTYIITDGADNASTVTCSSVANKVAEALRSEYLESILTILIGINTSECGTWLEQFKNEANLSQYVDAGDATPERLAKISNFVSESISSQSQALGTGGPSQALSF
jgi:uncharacterized protein YegL